MRCPREECKDGNLLKGNVSYMCDEHLCNFKISFEAFDKLINDLYKPKKERIITNEDNLTALNNLEL